MTLPLTSRQRQILEYIGDCLRDLGRPPTHREIAARFQIFYGTVQDHIAALVSKGALKRDKGKARGLVLPEGFPLPGLPVLGQVAAGTPIEAIEDADERLSLDKSLARDADFILRVKGDSMEPEMVEGDLVLARRAQEARSGELVIAHVGHDEATVKRFRRKGRDAYLEPANPKYEPIAKDFRVIAKVVGLIRRY